MSLLSDYEQRTAWKYQPVQGFFHTAEGLVLKVHPDGSYAPFRGTTVAFRLGKKGLLAVRLMQQALNYKLEGTNMLAALLPEEAAHMTLHDLVSCEMCCSAAEDEDAYGREMAESLQRAAGVVERIREEHAGRKIELVSDRIVSLVSKSLVLMLKPRTEADYELLLDLYGRFDEIVRLPYPLTPHITLGYFRPGMINGDTLQEALDFAQIDPAQAPVFEFGVESLTAQMFLDMQSYMDVPKRICFCCDGGLNRSVMAANILDHMAAERGLPVTGAARAAYPGTQGMPVSQHVWDTLEKHGIRPDRTHSSARYLELGEAAHFSEFAGISDGALGRFFALGIPEKRTADASGCFLGVRDPQYGEVSYEQAFAELRERTERWLDAFEREYKRHWQRADLRMPGR